ncbi:hypothetical protein NM688_g7659 [Phlebia brevispora]|uniref:Uncharacterized protein n=1 Tax=Phlebia brevispora TaxID=194682 RepID=A0ACC1S2K1_9APHY|nr:hypothetical protein NM688_g7659 [Phlebia brevispora]
MDPNDYAAAAALFKNPVPSHGPKRNTVRVISVRLGVRLNLLTEPVLHTLLTRLATNAGSVNCDTKRPCSTCVRSHAYAIAHATEESDIPDEPECTYGDPPKESPQPHSKVEKLENRISELEGLLRDMQLALEASQTRNNSARFTDAPALSQNFASPSASDVMSPNVSQYLDNSASFNNGIGVTATSAGGAGNASATGYASSSVSLTPNSGVFDNTFSQANGSDPVFDNVDFSQFGSPALPEMAGSLAQMADTQMADPVFEGAMIPRSLAQDRKTQLLLMGWPLHLPEPEVTRHLSVHAFFAFNMHAGRMFHGPSFLAALDLPPSDPRFPFSGLLHIMCAVGSLYTADVPSPPVQRRIQFHTNGQFLVLDELFPGRWRQLDQRPDTFAEQQVKYAKLVGDAALDRGEHLVEDLQTQIMLTWFYMMQARWSESYLAAGHALRCTIPCGINISSPFHGSAPSSMFRPEKPPSILPESQSVVEREMQRNMFWIAYSMERHHASGNSFAMVLDDMDICQLLPLRGDQYEQGISVPPDERQWSHDRHMFLNHPPNQTDSFILFIKGAILLSHVKNFNLRFRGRYFAGDAAMYSPSGSPADEPDKLDPRDTSAFQELDHLVTSFRQSWPPNFRNPVQDEMVDPYLFAASCGACLALILLHEPHARFTNGQDISTIKTLRGARGILDLMYALSATSYDVSLLDQLPILTWQVAGRVLVKALKACIDTKNYNDMGVLQAEVAFVHSMLAKAGERIPLAYRFKKMVYDFLASTCGRQFVESLPESSYHKGDIQPVETFENPVIMGFPSFC